MTEADFYCLVLYEEMHCHSYMDQLKDKRSALVNPILECSTHPTSTRSCEGNLMRIWLYNDMWWPIDGQVSVLFMADVSGTILSTS